MKAGSSLAAFSARVRNDISVKNKLAYTVPKLKDFSPEALNGALLTATLTRQHALLMMWNSHLYVLRGVVYRWIDSGPDGGMYTVIRKFLLLDARYSDSRRQAVFDRASDDFGKIQGFLFVDSTQP